MYDDPKEIEAIAYRCPECGEELKYNAASKNFTCDYCKTAFSSEEMAEVAKKTEAHQHTKPTEGQQAPEQNTFDSDFENVTNVYSCSNCGAEIMADGNTAATFCYYCHSPVILNGRVTGKYRPDSILPFQIAATEAKDIFKKWCKKKWFLPSDFNYEKQEGKMVGLYVPFWVTDCKLGVKMEALCKTTSSRVSGNYRITETDEYACAREANVRVNGIPADGASNIEDELMEACEPFDYNKVVPFAMQYMSGFQAEKYDVDEEGVYPRIEKRAKAAAESLVRNSMIGYDSVSVTHTDINIFNVDWKYMLLPVWFLSYEFKGKVYEFAINGQSGKFVGTPPLSRKKQFLFSLGAWLLTAALVVVLGVLMN